MTLIIKNVKEEFLPAFKGLAEGVNAKLETQIAESSANFIESAESGEKIAESDECPICKEYNYEPSDELLEAIAEFERGEAVHYDSFEDYKARIDSE